MNRGFSHRGQPIDRALIARCREIASGSGITADDVLTAIEEVRAEQQARAERLCGLVSPDRDR